MSKKIICCVLPCLMLFAALAAFGQAPAGQRGERGAAGGRGAAPAPRPDNPQSLQHIDNAKKIAGTDPYLKYPYEFFCIPANTRANNGNAPELEPVKLFDNLYAAGNSETTVYALTTSDGIILFDSGTADRVETVLVPGIQKLGLDLSKVKYILLGHGHADHFGGSAYFQEKYGTHVATTAADWDLMYPANPAPNQQSPPGRPRKDMVIKEGQPVKLGDVTVNVIEIPGHTPGSTAYIFPVKDHGKKRMVGIFAGTILAVDRITTEGLKQYVASIAHYLETAKKMKVEVEIQNHPIFDGSPDRIAKVRTLKGNEQNPYVVGNDKYVKFWNIISECIQAEIARRGTASN